MGLGKNVSNRLNRMIFSAGFWIFVLAIIAVFSLYMPADISVSSTSTKRELPIYCVQTDKPKVALSFDAAWGNEDTSQILEILANNKVHVTFFMTGGWVEKFPDDVKAIAAAGHDLGNHSENHKKMSELNSEECKEEIMSVHNKVKALTGAEMILFRPPYGDYNNNLITTTNSINYYTIQWDVDSLDWKNYGVESIINTVVNHKSLGNGSIILMHNGSKYTAEALDRVIKGIKEKGYEIVPLSQLIIRDNYSINHEGRQIPK